MLLVSHSLICQNSNEFVALATGLTNCGIHRKVKILVFLLIEWWDDSSVLQTAVKPVGNAVAFFKVEIPSAAAGFFSCPIRFRYGLELGVTDARREFSGHIVAEDSPKTTPSIANPFKSPSFLHIYSAVKA